MPSTILTAREFNHDTSRAKKATAEGPVFITDRGRLAHVLLTIEDYQRLTGQGQDIAELLGWPAGVQDVPFEPPRSRERPRPADFS